MTHHVALLRGVNVGGRAAVTMAELRALAADLGLEHPRTLLQSGNLVFRSAGSAPDDLERLLEAAIEARLGLRVDVMVRSAEKWREVIASNPFAAEAERDPARLVVLLLKQAPPAGAFEALQASIAGPERLAGLGRTAYIVYPDGQGDSRLTNSLIESRLGTRATARNWNTTLKLAAMLVE